MNVVTDIAACPRPARGSVVTIGVYDGVHSGHRGLIARVTGMAAQLNCDAALVTFDPHPATVVRPASAPKLLTDLEQRLELIAPTGIDTTLVIHFDEARSKESPEDFVREVLVDCLRARAVVVGHDFHFGHERRGDVPLLQRMGAQLGFDVLGLTLFSDGTSDEPVSSTRVRKLLVEGKVAEVLTLLGRPHEVRGTVEKGDGRGRELGFPTANVAVPPQIQLPADGVYAGWYERPDGSVLPAAMNVGRRPTFYDDAPESLLEAYILDFSGDLYGEPAKVRFVDRLRDEVRFDDIDDLVAQMHDDIADVRRVLRSRGGPVV